MADKTVRRFEIENEFYDCEDTDARNNINVLKGIISKLIDFSVNGNSDVKQDLLDFVNQQQS